MLKPRHWTLLWLWSPSDANLTLGRLVMTFTQFPKAGQHLAHTCINFYQSEASLLHMFLMTPGCSKEVHRPMCQQTTRCLFWSLFSEKVLTRHPALSLISQVSYRLCRMSLWKKLCGKAMANTRVNIPELLLVHLEHFILNKRIKRTSLTLLSSPSGWNLIFGNAYAKKKKKKKVPDHNKNECCNFIEF